MWCAAVSGIILYVPTWPRMWVCVYSNKTRKQFLTPSTLPRYSHRLFQSHARPLCLYIIYIHTLCTMSSLIARTETRIIIVTIKLVERKFLFFSFQHTVPIIYIYTYVYIRRRTTCRGPVHAGCLRRVFEYSLARPVKYVYFSRHFYNLIRPET